MTRLEARDGAFWREGAPHRVIAGSLHYFRVHQAQWGDRLERLRALGINTLDTYVAWNVHEAREGEYRFDGWRDVVRFVEQAGDAGLDVIVRPGPYICAEWTNGGLPVWLTARERALRTSASGFMDPVERWFDELLPRLAPLQASHGGPIVAWQVENEYGSFGDDQDYLHRVRAALIDRGVSELLYTADGATAPMTRRGSIDGTLATYTFGTEASAAELLRLQRGDGALFCAEFWNGWFDHWGERHHTRDGASASTTLRELFELGGSVSVYMAHGGTNHGLWAGANHDGRKIQPTVTSYDSDAPIGEDGRLGPKFAAMREVFAAYTESPLPEPPAPPRFLASARLPLTHGASALDGLRASGSAVRSPLPPSFEDLGLAEGLVLYSTTTLLDGAPLHVDGLRDRAQVYVDGALRGTLTRDGVTSCELAAEGMVELELMVETLGRINYGALLGERKGITGGVRLERAFVHGWDARAIALDEWTTADLDAAVAAAPVRAEGPGFSVAPLAVTDPADAWITIEGGTKGFVWVNGSLLGRFWSIGPQLTQYAPAPLWHTGDNIITVLDLEGMPTSVVIGQHPEFGEPEAFVARLD